jgi:[ribosomal protein S18]-alanine N-acetyltransferase
VEVRPLSADDAAAIAAWRYPGRYSTYDVNDPAALETSAWGVIDGGELIGHCCFGALARVPPAVEEAGTLDVGYGLAPELMGDGLGPAFVGAILDFALDRFAPERLRLYVLDWNERSRKVAAGHGFAVESVMDNEEGRFLVMIRPAGS